MRKRTTAKALLMSVLALMLCLSMLVGTTFAWFTDSVTSGVNKIVAGNLDIEVEYNVPNEDGTVDETKWKNLEGSDSLFSGNLWEPGHTELVYLRIKNAGTLSLNYKVLVSPVSESTGISVKTNEKFKLSTYLKFATTQPSETFTKYSDRKAVQDVIGEGEDLKTGMAAPGSIQANGADQYMALAVYMPESVGNEANYKTGTPAPFIELGITVVATQMQDENDSFGPDYDAAADLSPDNIDLDRVDYSSSDPVSVTGSVQKDATAGTTTSSSTNVTVDAEQNVTVKSGATSVIIPASQIPDGSSEIRLDVTETLAPNGFTLETGKGAVHYDVTPTINGEPLETPTTDGSLYVATIPVGAALEDVTLYHENVALPNSDPGDGGEYFNYNPTKGVITAYVKHFSPFSVTFKAVASINGKNYGTLESAVTACKAGETIELLSDITARHAYTVNKVWKVATTFLYGTLDGNGHTITLPKDVNLGCVLQNGGCLKNVTVEANDTSVFVYAYNGTFDHVKVTGSIEVGNNTGAYVTYGYPQNGGTLTFIGCDMGAKLYGAGASTNYNAAFIGYGLGAGSTEFLFEDCMITGSLSCGVAALFIGNDSQLIDDWKVTVNNFTAGEGAEIRNTLTSGYSWKFNGIVAANAAYGTPTVTIDGVEYKGAEGFAALVDAKNEKWPTLFKYGPEDASLALTRNEDGTFTITPAATEGVTKYVVSVMVYAGLKEGGSLVQKVSETIEVTEGASYVTTLKDLKFVDQQWVDAHPEAVQGELAGNVTYTLDGTTYYMMSSSEATLNGNPKSAQVYSVTAYDSNGTIVASASLT